MSGAAARNGPAALLLLSLLAVAVAPLLMASGFDIVDHSVSESAAQGVRHGWVARTGFVLWGVAALWLAARPGTRWERLLLGLFGACMFGAALFPTRPWQPSLPYDRFTDTAHSLFASAMGMAFVMLVLLRLLLGPRRRARDAAALVVSSLVPAIMAIRPDLAGAAQRLMFAVAYFWFLREALGPAGRR